MITVAIADMWWPVMKRDASVLLPSLNVALGVIFFAGFGRVLPYFLPDGERLLGLDGSAGDEVLPGGSKAKVEEEKLLQGNRRLAVLLVLTLTLHNLPEGVAVAVSSRNEPDFLLVLAVALHNIPEGLAIASPVMAATHDGWQAIWLSTASGLSEPLGALLTLLVLDPLLGVTEESLDGVLCGVAGVMIGVSINELLPQAHEYNRPQALWTGMAAGVIVMGIAVSYG